MTGGAFPEGITEFQERFTEMGKKIIAPCSIFSNLRKIPV